MHGKDYKYLESIIKYGLKLPKTKLENGYITPPPRAIQKTEEMDGIKNWEKAIFTSPDVLCASLYSTPIIINDCEHYFCLIEVMIKPNSYTLHDTQDLIKKYSFFCVNPEDMENIKEKMRKNFGIYRITNEKNIIVKSIIFIKNYFINNLSYVEPQNQRNLLLKQYGIVD